MIGQAKGTLPERPAKVCHRNAHDKASVVQRQSGFALE
jgi:hypothetical protein